MNEIKVTTELCKEDRQRIDDLLYILARTCTALESIGTPFPATTAEKAPTEAPDAPQDAPEVKGEDLPTPKAETPTAPTAAAKAVSVGDIQQKVMDLALIGKKEEARAVVKAYADRISAIPEDKLTEVWDKLTALEG